MARQFDNREKMADLFFAISYYRRRRGMSQEQLAEELGISRQHLAAIEAPNMNRGLSLELLFNSPGDRTLSSVEIQPGKMTLTIPAMKAQTKSPSPALFRFPGCSPAPAGLIFL